jgi:protein-S-isoprenylcysteine O-methyltransferase Ste14
MMCDAILVLLLGNFALIGLLPVVFFRRDGRFNARWFMTSAPFFVVPLLLILGRIDALHPLLTEPLAVRIALNFAAVTLSASSVALLAATVTTHRIPLALWHQVDDAPVEIVTAGPYARIRHPFYTSFLLAFAAAFLALPHAATFVCLLYACAALSFTAGREERRLAASEFGGDYRRYMATTGRFLPKLRS